MTDGADPHGIVVDRDMAERFRDHLAGVYEDVADERILAARSVGDAVRRLIEVLTATSAPVETLRDVETLVADATGRLDAYGSGRRYEGTAEASGLGRDRAFFDWSPQLGVANPLAPPIRVSIEDGTVIGRARFGAAYEGPPGCVHGGYVAAAFDEVLGLTQSLSGQMGMTGSLSVRYIRPTPLHSDLVFEGRLEKLEGRKVTTSATLMSGGEVTAEATGLFVTVTPERFAAMASRRRRP